MNAEEHQPDVTPDRERLDDAVRLRTALLIYFGSLAAAMAAACPAIGGVMYAPLFPLGLAASFSQTRMFGVFSAAAYAAYAVFLCLFITLRQRPVFYSVVVAYVIMLLLNVAGCHQVWHGLQSIN